MLDTLGVGKHLPIDGLVEQVKEENGPMGHLGL